MKKTTFLPLLGLVVVASLTAFSATKAVKAKSDPLSFEDFLKQFPAQRLPYVLDEQSMKVNLDRYVDARNGRTPKEGYVNAAHLDWQYYQFLPELERDAMFSRIPMQVEPIALFTDGDYRAVLYSTSRGIRFAYANFTMTVFNKEGAFVSTNNIGSIETQRIVSAFISKGLTVEMKHWKINWKKNYEEVGVNGNSITGLEFDRSITIDLTKPTPKPEDPFKRTIEPPVIEEKVAPQDNGTKSE